MRGLRWWEERFICIYPPSILLCSAVWQSEAVWKSGQSLFPCVSLSLYLSITHSLHPLKGFRPSKDIHRRLLFNLKKKKELLRRMDIRIDVAWAFVKVWLAEFFPDEVSIEKKKKIVIWIFFVHIYQWKEIFKKNSFPEFEKILTNLWEHLGFISDQLVLIDSWVNWSTLMGKFKKGNIPVKLKFLKITEKTSWAGKISGRNLVKIQHSLDLIQDMKSVPWTANSFFTGS